MGSALETKATICFNFSAVLTAIQCDHCKCKKEERLCTPTLVRWKQAQRPWRASLTFPYVKEQQVTANKYEHTVWMTWEVAGRLLQHTRRELLTRHGCVALTVFCDRRMTHKVTSDTNRDHASVEFNATVCRLMLTHQPCAHPGVAQLSINPSLILSVCSSKCLRRQINPTDLDGTVATSSPRLTFVVSNLVVKWMRLVVLGGSALTHVSSQKDNIEQVHEKRRANEANTE